MESQGVVMTGKGTTGFDNQKILVNCKIELYNCMGHKELKAANANYWEKKTKFIDTLWNTTGLEYARYHKGFFKYWLNE